jgi:hypothetical protein
MTADPRPSLEEIRQRAEERIDELEAARRSCACQPATVWCRMCLSREYDSELLRDLLAVLPQEPAPQGKIGEALGLSGNILCVPKESHD